MSIKIKYENGFSFDIDNVTENYDANSGMTILTIRLPMKNDITEVEGSFVSENLKSMSVVKNGEIVSVFKGYIKVQSSQKVIDKFQQTLNITLTKT